MYPIEQIRQDFPILQIKNRQGKPLVYLDNAATTQKPRAVIDRLQAYYAEGNANIHRGIYELAQKATEDYEESRVKIQKFIGAKHAEEIIFVSGTTEGINLVASSFLAPRLKAGDEVMITAMEHHANLVPWQILCQQCQAKLVIIPIDEQGDVNMEIYRQLLNKRTRFVTLVHTSNTLGTINPVEEMIALAKERDIPVLIDGAQSIAHQKIAVQEMNCDFFTFSGHKIYGPTGIGALYVKKELLEKMNPYRYGGEMIRTVSYEKSTFNRVPHKFEAGTPHISGAIGLGAALEYVQKIGIENIKAHLQMLLEYATPKMLAIPGLRIIGQAQQKSSIISFLINEVHPHDIGTILNESGVAIRAGHHCTMPLMHYYEIPGTARASFGLYNNLEDIDKLLEALQEVERIFA